MVKTVKKEDIDEKAIIASFLQDEPTDHDSLVNETRESAEEPPAVQAEAPKEESRRRKSKGQDYENLFIRNTDTSTRSGKTAYIRKEFHDRITRIVQVIAGNELTLFSYLDNVLEHHFNTYQEEISDLYKKRNTDDIF